MMIQLDTRELVSQIEAAFRKVLEEGVGDREPGLLDVKGAAEFLATTDDALRSMVKRKQVPVVRLPNGRLRFDPVDLNAWARGQA